MDFGNPKPNFEEVDHSYAQLKRQAGAGQITEEEFDEQLKRMMVQDQSGRWWAKSRRSGEWYCHDGKSWAKGTPPGYTQPALDQQSSEHRPDTLMEEHPNSYAGRPRGHSQNEGEQRSTEPSSSLGRLIVLPLVAVVVVLGIGGVLFLTTTQSTKSEDNSSRSAIPTPPGTPSETTTIVPNLEGKTLSDAAQTVGSDYPLEVRGVASTEDSNDQPKGTIAAQEPDPSEGEPAPKGTVIGLYLSGGQEEVMVPDVSGLSVLEASKTLLEAGLFPASDPNGSLGARDIQVVKLDRSGTPGTVIDKQSDGGDEKDLSQRPVTSATLSDSTPAAGSKANPGDLIFLAY